MTPELILTEVIPKLSLIAIFALGSVSFLVLYLGFAGIGHFLTLRLLPALGIGAVLDTRAQLPHQRKREIAASMLSVGIFGLYGVLTVVAMKAGWVHIQTKATVAKILADCVLIFFWNEIHFYLCHRLLHRPWFMRKVHRVHHSSIIPTPYSTYSFHWFESALLSTVMLSVMLLRDFHYVAIVILPVLSIAANTLGHLNYDAFPRSAEWSFFSMIRRHGLHHQRGRGNFGFLLPWFDMLFGTVSGTKRPFLRLPMLLNQRNKYAWGVVLFIVTSTAYLLSNRFHIATPEVLSPGGFERWVPQLPWTVWIYASYPILFIVAYLSERDNERLNAYFYSILAINLLSQLVFVFFPTTILRTELGAIPDSDGLGIVLLGMIQSVDTPANCVPSLHVSASVLAALVIAPRSILWKWFCGIWALAIAISTLTTEQHYLVDVVCGSLLALACYWVFYQNTGYSERTKVDR